MSSSEAGTLQVAPYETQCLGLSGAPGSTGTPLASKKPSWVLFHVLPDPSPSLHPLPRGAPAHCRTFSAILPGPSSAGSGVWDRLHLPPAPLLVLASPSPSSHDILGVPCPNQPQLVPTPSPPPSINPEELYQIFPFCPLLYLSSVFLQGQ